MMTIALIVMIPALLTISLIFIQYDKHHNRKKLIISFITFGVILSFLFLGNITKAILPLYILHYILVVVSWVGLIKYILFRRYRYSVIFSPSFTIVMFLILEYLVGSS